MIRKFPVSSNNVSRNYDAIHNDTAKFRSDVITGSLEESLEQRLWLRRELYLENDDDGVMRITLFSSL